MENILDRIVQKLSIDLVQTKKRVPTAALLDAIQRHPPVKDFAKAITQKKYNVICELKKASPSKGLIRENLEIESLAHDFECASASALSVLTERHFFLGSSDNLVRARAACTLPILRKDFIFDTYQILEARAWGADAILLIAAILDAEEFTKLHTFARSLGLSVLCEAHTENEIEMLLENKAEIIGVNARNLATFKTDLHLSKTLIAKIPKNIITVAESAITSHEDLESFSQAGTHAFLIGETLMRAENPAQKLKELLQ